MRLFPALICLAFIGCGGKPAPKTVPIPPIPAPVRAVPRSAAGEDIKRLYQPARRPTAVFSAAPRGIDVSQWQGAVPNLTGLSFVLIQSNAGFFVNPFLSFQIADANARHVPWGAYTFLEPGVSGSAEASQAISLTNNHNRKLGVWADAERSGAYEHACAYTQQAKNEGQHIYGLYSAPGLWPGGVCKGYLWPAEWSGGTAYPFGGYGRSAIKVRQYCGTCFRYGKETDLDESLGLLSLIAKPPTPLTPAQRHAIEHQINLLRVDIRRHGCTVAPYHGRGKYHAICKHWLALGAADHQRLKENH